MTQIIKDLDHVYRKHHSPTEHFLERTFNRFAVAVIAVSLILCIYMIARIALFPPPPRIQNELTPAERKHISYLEKKYKLKGHTWLIDRDTQEVSYYRKGEWRVIR